MAYKSIGCAITSPTILPLIQPSSVTQTFLFLFRHISILGPLYWLSPPPQVTLTMNNLASFNCFLVHNPPKETYSRSPI